MNQKNLAKVLFLVLLFALQNNIVSAQESQTIKFVNGQWFDGNSFAEKTWYASNGLFEESISVSPDTVIDLGGGYVIAPLGDAHHHNLNEEKTIEEQVQRFLNDGVYYVMVQDVILDLTPSILKHINGPGKLEVTYTKGPLIHPKQAHVDFYKSLGEQGLFGEKNTIQELNGYAFNLISDKEDIENLWPSIRRYNPDFIKVILTFSDYYDERVNDSTYYTNSSLSAARPGINTELLPLIVQKAHNDGLRVSCHVETAADFAVAVEAGVDLIAHLPGWQIGDRPGFDTVDINRWIIDRNVARKAARKDIGVITTTYPKPYIDLEKYGEDMNTIHTRNLQTLKDENVNILIGVDNGNRTAVDELFHINHYGVFSPLELIKIVTSLTPSYIFPDQRIGILKPGFEASFLVLEKNPLEDLQNLRTITLKIKDGIIIR